MDVPGAQMAAQHKGATAARAAEIPCWGQVWHSDTNASVDASSRQVDLTTAELVFECQT